MIKTVLLDLDDTILDFKKAESLALSRTLLQMGLEPTQDVLQRYSEINQAQWQLLEENKLTRAQVVTRRFSLLFEEKGIHADVDKVQSLYREELGKGHFFLPGAQELLEELFAQYDLYLVSNGNGSVQDGRIQSAGIAKYFQKLFISERMGVNKPAKEFFDLCFAQIGDVEPEKTVIIGDSLTSDIRGGINAGIHTLWYNPHGQPVREDIRPEYQVKSLDEIPAVLKGI
ncbi:MAG: YjjG family noncanonical pyrimidine nucleotidase [Lachnospiraceae bacterium]